MKQRIDVLRSYKVCSWITGCECSNMHQEKFKEEQQLSRILIHALFESSTFDKNSW